MGLEINKMFQTGLAILAIAGGGALGALVRYAAYGLSFSIFGSQFPFGTLLVNVIGSFLMGIAIAYFELYVQPLPHVRLFIMTGFLGAMTTFSNFSMDAVLMFEKGDMVLSALYIAGTVFASIFALYGGLSLIRQTVS